MNFFLLFAFLLTLAAFFIHTFLGDKEISLLKPLDLGKQEAKMLEIWTMTRSGWHWISLDLLFASLGLGLILFTDILPSEELLLKILSFYFGAYGIIWIFILLISPSFSGKFMKLGQWLLLIMISLLIFGGIQFL
ncbi:MAG: hypothetical protein AAFY71_09470 [Bacteroidota bacterium]